MSDKGHKWELSHQHDSWSIYRCKCGLYREVHDNRVLKGMVYTSCPVMNWVDGEEPTCTEARMMEAIG